MPGRSFYSGDPTALEAALAQQVGSGTSPFAGALLTGYATQRQANAQHLNELQQQQYLLGLQSLLDQERIKAGATILGNQVKGGHGIGSAMGAANAGGYTQYDPTDIEREKALGSAGQVAGIAKTTGEASDASVKAGTPLDLSSLNGIAPGILHMGQGTPLDITKEGMGNKTDLEVARIHAAATEAAATTRGPSGQGKDEVKVKDTYILPGHNVERSGPEAKMRGTLSPEDQKLVFHDDAGTAVQDQHNKVDVHDASGDTAQQDPELAAQKDYLVQHGFTLLNGHGDPRPWSQNGKIGKKFVVIDKNGITSEQFVPNARQ